MLPSGRSRRAIHTRDRTRGPGGRSGCKRPRPRPSQDVPRSPGTSARADCPGESTRAHGCANRAWYKDKSERLWKLDCNRRRPASGAGRPDLERPASGAWPASEWESRMAFKVQVDPAQIAIHQGQTVLVTEPDGQVNWPSQRGLYFRDTRVISAWAIYANGTPWDLLNGGAVASHAARICE